ncbi:hypothetical protein [Brevundimonas sp.]|uniref:hypothetical protein n=1 Tax=Brevundimonas sp. TaxID=1871086 RepID=UPI002898D05A|nr:hypothetical protein [Brevundimonas sp.]
MAGAIDQTATCNHCRQVRGDRQRRPTNRIGTGHHPLLDGAGGVSAKQAKAPIEAQHDCSQALAIYVSSPMERCLVETARTVKALAADTPKREKRRAG